MIIGGFDYYDLLDCVVLDTKTNKSVRDADLPE